MNLPVNTLLQGGKYKIIRFINSGGFGCTYEAEHSIFKKRVAIKEFFVKDFCNRDDETHHVTVGTLSKKELVWKLKKKFIEEACSLFDMQHPGIVRVIDTFEENETAYYVMEYIEGTSLHELVKTKGKLSEKEAIGYIKQVCDAMQYVHGKNRLHLDIKPGNIMVDQAGKAVLIDFGASKHYNTETGENTSTLMGVNTPGYAPYEQVTQTFTTFNPSTDIYAIGATLYKLLTGATPHDAVSLMAGDKKLEALPKEVSESTCLAIERAMQPQRANRPQSIAEFLTLLNSVVTKPAPDQEVPRNDQEKQDETVITPTKGNEDKDKTVVSPLKKEKVYNEPKPTEPKPRKNKGLKIVLGLVALLLLFAGGYFISQSGETDDDDSSFKRKRGRIYREYSNEYDNSYDDWDVEATEAPAVEAVEMPAEEYYPYADTAVVAYDDWDVEATEAPAEDYWY